MQSIGIRRTIAAEMRHLRGVCGLVARGTGVALIDPIAELLLDREKVVSCPLVPTIEWEIALFTPKNRLPAEIVTAFINKIRIEIERLQAKGLVK